MKKLFFYLITVFIITGCDNNKKELYKETDAFVESLHTTFESYGMNGLKYANTTVNYLMNILKNILK